MPRNLIPNDATLRREVRANDLKQERARAEAAKVPLERLSDGDGLYLLLGIKGVTHAWRMDYTLRGVRKTLSLGTYPDVSLAAARVGADRIRSLVASGADPSGERKAVRAADRLQRERDRLIKTGKPLPGSFEHVAREWIAMVREPANSADHAERALIRLERDIFPWLGALPKILESARVLEEHGLLPKGERAADVVKRYVLTHPGINRSFGATYAPGSGR